MIMVEYLLKTTTPTSGKNLSLKYVLYSGYLSDLDVVFISNATRVVSCSKLIL